MIRKHGYFITLISLTLSLLMLASYHYIFSPKIKYVQTDKLVYGYEGMKEYQQIYQKKVGQLKANVDSLGLDFERSVEAYKGNYAKLGDAQRREKEGLLQKQEQNFLRYKESVQAQMGKEDSEMTGKALEQISSFVQAYGKKKGYTLILGTTETGSILYGTPNEDITEELLKELNLYYKGKTK